jgi:hypothetical protein
MIYEKFTKCLLAMDEHSIGTKLLITLRRITHFSYLKSASYNSEDPYITVILLPWTVNRTKIFGSPLLLATTMRPGYGEYRGDGMANGPWYAIRQQLNNFYDFQSQSH